MLSCSTEYSEFSVIHSPNYYQLTRPLMPGINERVYRSGEVQES